MVTRAELLKDLRWHLRMARGYRRHGMYLAHLRTLDDIRMIRLELLRRQATNLRRVVNG
jgi:hypothetical protein